MPHRIQTAGAGGAQSRDFMSTGLVGTSHKHSPWMQGIQQVSQFMVGIVASLLLSRFLIALFGLGQTGSPLSFVAMLTEPLVIPFHSLVSQTDSLGASRFEIDTLLATITYVLTGAIVLAVLGFLHNRQ